MTARHAVREGIVRGSKGRVLALLVTLLLQTSCASNRDESEDQFCPAGADMAAYVDPMIGTLGSGNAVPGALVPHGMVKLSPDSVVEPGSVDAYEYGSDRIEGFSHTHLQGPGGGANGYSHILFMPTTGELETDSQAYASKFSHESEEASPGYYAVTLDDYGVRAELTATAHAGVHRYTFQDSGEARVLIDIGHSRGESRGGEARITDGNVIQGNGVYNVHPLLDLLLSKEERTVGRSVVYFYAVFDEPFSSHGTWCVVEDEVVVKDGSSEVSGIWAGAFATFPVEAGESIEARVGISMVDVEQARMNLESEVGEKTFEQVREAAREKWNCLLNRVAVETQDEVRKRIFYTALYHTLLAPADYTEAGGVFFSGADGIGDVYEWPDRRFYTDDWCAWDTFRTSRPLATLVEPEMVDDLIASYLHLYDQGGWLPKCTWHATGYSSVMIGNHAVSMIADAAVKGFSGFDMQQAWDALEKSATRDDPSRLVEGFCGYVNLGTPPEYVEQGYVSRECDTHQGASMTLEYAYNDWCIARFAKHTGDEQASLEYEQRALNYANNFNPETGFMQGRHRDGGWVEPFDPADDSDANDFCEASSWIYTWFVPHDVGGLVELMGGREIFLDKLDGFFSGEHFEPSNEPSFHIPYLYNYVGEPGRTQDLVGRTLEQEFSVQPGGLPGNDDAGATSAWLVFSAMGLYPVSPGDGKYQLTRPWFDRVVLHLNPAFSTGQTFEIETSGSQVEDAYIQSATLNGEPLGRTWISHAEIVSGGVLMLEMGPDPVDWTEAP